MTELCDFQLTYSCSYHHEAIGAVEKVPDIFGENHETLPVRINNYFI